MIIICMNIQQSLFPDIMIAIGVLLLLAAFISLSLLHTHIRKIEHKFMEMQLLLQKEYDTAKYYDALHKRDEKQKILIHDIKKHLHSIAELSERHETGKITAYINQIVQSADLQDSLRVCDNDLLNTIIFRAKQHCRETGTSFMTDIRAGCVDSLSEYDITALFGNLLDNAMEAAKDIPDSFIELSVTPHGSSNFIITMINSCKNDPFVGKDRHLVSGKKNPWQHGYGMKSIQRVIEKYNGSSNLYFDAVNLTFHTVMIFPCP